MRALRDSLRTSVAYLGLNYIVSVLSFSENTINTMKSQWKVPTIVEKQTSVFKCIFAYRLSLMVTWSGFTPASFCASPVSLYLLISTSSFFSSSFILSRRLTHFDPVCHWPFKAHSLITRHFAWCSLFKCENHNKILRISRYIELYVAK